jgi:ribosome biogenesis GTPase
VAHAPGKSIRQHGIVIAAHGRAYRIRLASGIVALAFPRGKKSEAACGDQVEASLHGDGQAAIEKILPRKNLLSRADAYKSKAIAANVDQAVIVVACEPDFSEELACRCLIAAKSQGIAPLVVLNKCDLPAALLERGRRRTASLAAFGAPIVELSARHDASPLLPWLAGKASVLAGPSGMGKSTLINALVPGALAATGEISRALDSGRHTTTYAACYDLPGGGALIDSPGLQTFGLAGLDIDALAGLFPEFAPCLGQCRFRDCRHEKEPGCALRAAEQAGAFAPGRLALFLKLAQELEGQGQAPWQKRQG